MADSLGVFCKQGITVPGEPCHIRARTSVIRRLATDTRGLAVQAMSGAAAGCGEARNDLLQSHHPARRLTRTTRPGSAALRRELPHAR